MCSTVVLLRTWFLTYSKGLIISWQSCYTADMQVITCLPLTTATIFPIGRGILKLSEIVAFVTSQKRSLITFLILWCMARRQRNSVKTVWSETWFIDWCSPWKILHVLWHEIFLPHSIRNLFHFVCFIYTNFKIIINNLIDEWIGKSKCCLFWTVIVDTNTI